MAIASRWRVTVAVALLAIATLATAAVASTAGRSTRIEWAASRLGTCGVERWSVKTLQDRPDLLPPEATTVTSLVRLPRPQDLPDVRLPFERHVYTVVAAVTLIRSEDDRDLHIVLRSGDNQMIAEAPDAPSCAPGATPRRRVQMMLARSRVRVCAKARVTGVAFWDFKHGQTGVAPNAIELHPILGFACLSKGGPPPPPPPHPGGKCAASYPTVCIPPPPPDLDCGDIRYRNFRVRWGVPDPDPHHFDGDHNGVGCQGPITR